MKPRHHSAAHRRQRLPHWTAADPPHHAAVQHLHAKDGKDSQQSDDGKNDHYNVPPRRLGSHIFPKLTAACH
jgi:hypothetical protein